MRPRDASVAWTADGTLLAPWVLSVANAEGRCVLSQRGTAKAMFRAAPRGVRGDRVARLELTFDTIGLWQQLTRASRSPVAEPYAAVPNTLEDALQESKDARVVTSATRPFVIEHVNDAWVRLCGFSADEAVGKTLACLQGPLSKGRDHEDRRPGGARPRVFRADHELHEAGPTVPELPASRAPGPRQRRRAAVRTRWGSSRTSSRSSPASDAEKKKQEKPQKNSTAPTPLTQKPSP